MDYCVLAYLANIQNIINTFLYQSTLTGVMLNIGMALVTIFIAVAIFLVQDATNTFEFDRKVLLNNGLKVKELFVSLVFLFSPLLFWDMSPISIKCLIFGLFMISAINISGALFKAYKWMDVFMPKEGGKSTNYRMSCRLEYFDKITDSEERRYEWNYLWKKANSLSTVEVESYLGKFTANIDKLIREDDKLSYRYASQYISDLENYLNNLPLYDWRLYEDLLKNSFDWYHIAFEKAETDPSDGREIFPLRVSLEKLIGSLVSSIGSNNTDYILYEELKKHIENKSPEYLENLMKLVSQKLFDMSTDRLSTIFGDHFPPDWKITKEKLVDQENLVVRFLLVNYLNWAQRRLWEHKEEYDKNLETVSYDLFPTIDPNTWSSLLTFIFSSSVDENKVETFVANGKIFGFGSRIVTASGEHTDEELDEIVGRSIQANIQSTLEIVLELSNMIPAFGSVLSTESIGQFISDAENLNYHEESPEEVRRQELLRILRELRALQSNDA